MVVPVAAQAKVQQVVLLHQDMDIQVRLNKDIPVVPRGLDCITVAVVAQGRKGRMEAYLLQERAEWGHLFPGYLQRMGWQVQRPVDGLRAAAAQAVCKILAILQAAQVAQVEVVLGKDNLDQLGSQVMLIPAVEVVELR
jgi:hypothetical protein